MHRIHHAYIVVLLFGIFLGLAPWNAQGQSYVFGTASFAAPGTGPMITADFNGDGIPDLAIVGPSTITSPVVSILLGKPDGTFAPKVDYSVPAETTNNLSIVAGDFHGEGKLDIICLFPLQPALSILVGNGDGTFQPAAALNVGLEYGTGNAWTFAAADLNGDGKLDLVLSGPEGSYGTGEHVTTLMGNGDGTFQDPVSYPTNIGGYIIARDFNGDGRPDIAVTDYVYSTESSQVAVLINKGDGTFQSAVYYALSGRVLSLAAADLNADGKLDLVVPTGGTSAGVSVLLGIGDGSFASPITYTSNLLSIYASSVTVADFNGDGKLDLALTNSTSPHNAVAILLGNGDGTFQNPPLLFSAGLQPAGVVAMDVNRDGKPDLAVVGGYGTLSYLTVTVLINQGAGNFPHATSYPAIKYPWTAVGGDFNGDGKPDIAVASITTTAGGRDNGGAVSVFLNNGDGTFQPRLDTPTSYFPFVIAPGDFNGDGILDLVVAEETEYGIFLSTWIGNGDGTFQNSIILSLPYIARSLAVGDFNHDGKLDVAATVDYAGAVYVFLGNGDGTFSTPKTYPTGASTNMPGYNLVTADFNGDGNLDLAVTTDQGISILLGKGDGTFGPYTAILPGEELLALADFNGDGKPDLAIVTSYGINFSVALGNGDGTFHQASVYQFPSIIAFSSPTVGDFNGDGKLDIAFSSQSECVITIAFGNGDGTLSHHLEFSTPQVPALVAADFNGDGALDLAMTDVTNQQVAVLLNSPVTALYPSSLNFAGQLLGIPSSAQTVSMSNPSPVPVSFSSIETAGDFSETDDCNSELMASASCQVGVTFTPTAAGILPGMLVFNDSVPGSPQAVTLSGTGMAAPLAGLSAPDLGFGNQALGTTSLALAETVTNTGTGNLTISTVAIGGANASDFTQSVDTCTGATVTPNGTCTVSVAFCPWTKGTRSGTLTFTDNNSDVPGSTQAVTLSGTGMVPVVHWPGPIILPPGPPSLPVPGRPPMPPTVPPTGTSGGTGTEPVVRSPGAIVLPPSPPALPVPGEPAPPPTVPPTGDLSETGKKIVVPPPGLTVLPLWPPAHQLLLKPLLLL